MSGVVWNRSRQRLVHLALGIVLGVFLYSPLRSIPEAEIAVRAVVFPVLTVSGVLMWKGHAIRRYCRARRAGGGS